MTIHDKTRYNFCDVLKVINAFFVKINLFQISRKGEMKHLSSHIWACPYALFYHIWHVNFLEQSSICDVYHKSHSLQEIDDNHIYVLHKFSLDAHSHVLNFYHIYMTHLNNILKGQVYHHIVFFYCNWEIIELTNLGHTTRVWPILLYQINDKIYLHFWRIMFRTRMFFTTIMTIITLSFLDLSCTGTTFI